MCGHGSSKASAFSFAMELPSCTDKTLRSCGRSRALHWFIVRGSCLPPGPGAPRGLARRQGLRRRRRKRRRAASAPGKRQRGAQPLPAAGLLGKTTRPWEVTVPTAFAVPLSPADRRAPGEGAWGVGVGEPGAARTPPHQVTLTGGHGQLAGGPAGLGLRQVAHRGAAQDVHLRAAATRHTVLRVPQSKGTPAAWGPAPPRLTSPSSTAMDGVSTKAKVETTKRW